MLLEICLCGWAVYIAVFGPWLVMGMLSTLAEAAGKNRIRVRVMDITEVVWRAMGD